MERTRFNQTQSIEQLPEEEAAERRAAFKIVPTSPIQMTRTSLCYRQKAQQLSIRSDQTDDTVEQVELVIQALRWIALAEDDESLEASTSSVTRK